MKYFDIGEVEVSRLGFGCMRFPVIDGDNGKINKEESEKLLLDAIERGLNYIDTAYPYHEETSEDFIGEFLQKHNLRNRVQLATKLPCWLVKKEEDFERLLNLQLEKLQTDYIDFYLLHSLDIKRFRKIVDLGVLDFCKKIKEKGIVKHIGFSFHDEYPAFEEIFNAYDWDFCQIQLNYLDIDYQAGMKGYELATKNNVPVIIMEPLKGGRLSNPPEEIKEMSKKFEPLSYSQVALKFPLSLQNVMTVLSGMNSHKQVEENCEMADSVEYNSLTDEEKEFYKVSRKVYKDRERIGCTACEYCMPCTVEINIPKVFSLWNKAFLYDEEDKSKKDYKEYLKDGVSPEECIECGKCEDICPQHLEIIKGLKDAHEYLK
ncbi:aldo/keto reductase [Mediannikoviicoccus vaginalis]|uniref:aldo/keto reductase n=1 Tax=Mediannikoviicoccus vaginalis TaxID=2899727 RepID=UPI001F1BD022|nr:aldo/keto reductase [Mediannikoviicoccus vaginalis]